MVQDHSGKEDLPLSKQMAIPIPPGFSLERTATRLKITGSYRRWPYTLLPTPLNKLIVTIEAGQIEIEQTFFLSRVVRFDTSSIEQLYVKEIHDLSETHPKTIEGYSYNLYLVTQEGKHFPIVTGLAASAHALYLEQEIERYLGLADRKTLHETESYRGNEAETEQSQWQMLAARHNLTFTSRSILKGGYISGYYRGHYLELDSLAEKQGASSETSTRLLVLANPTPVSRRPQDELILAALTRLLAYPVPSFPLMGRIQFEPDGQAIRYEQAGIETKEEVLQFLFDTLTDLIKLHPEIVALGGKVAPMLYAELARDKRPFHRVARQMLVAIAEDTSNRLAGRASRLRCDSCLGACVAYFLTLSTFETIRYYACQACGQSRDFTEFEGRTIAVLDSQLETERVWQEDILRVNWLVRRELFSFDEVEVVMATDEEVERFAVQAGNDTNTLRRSRYPEMGCRISPGCHLTENTLRILKRTFGSVTKQ